MAFHAHSADSDGKPQGLSDHLRQVADSAKTFGGDIENRLQRAAEVAGLLHDLGKYAAEFQARLDGTNPKRVVHALQGATWAVTEPWKAFDVGMAIAGHHAGIPSLSEFLQKVGHFPVEKFWKDAVRDLPELASLVLPTMPAALKDKLKADVWVRLLFSCLVDADFLDTERHFDPDRANLRVETELRPNERLARLLSAIEVRAATMDDGLVKRTREEVLQACLNAAELPPGFFSLTVPTGGGKTLASMAFALKHAERHRLRRAICVLPFLNIIEQNASVLRKVFGAEFVLEHHSLADDVGRREADRPNDKTHVDDGTERETPRQRLAVENWDAPFVITTSVQFFESLFANRPSRCRKVHNVPRSVVILDECQTLPPGLIEPILSMLKVLVSDYGTTVVFCTATQPAFRQRTKLTSGIPSNELREIIPDPARLFDTMRRTRPVWPKSNEDRRTWPQVASRLAKREQALCIVNLRKHAAELFQQLINEHGRRGVFHLSTNLCPAHRLRKFQEIRERLHRGERCRVVATQLVEAGVDLDFPFVMRAFGPFDAIAQAAGRCNREGLCSELGVVEIFIPEDDGMPPAEYRRAAETTKAMLEHARRSGLDGLDIHDPATFNDYFERFYGGESLDKKDIQTTAASPRQKLDFPEVADRFRLIDNVTTPVFITDSVADPLATELLATIRQKLDVLGFIPRDLSRRMQRLQVQRWPHEFRDDQAKSRVEMLTEDVWLWRGKYDEDLGVIGGEDVAFDPNKFVI